LRPIDDLRVPLRSTQSRRETDPHPFLFATGIECSDPVSAGGEGRSKRIDELALTGLF
jgi:hypothetical protein